MISLHELINTLDHNLSIAEQQDNTQVMALETNIEKMRKFVLVRIDDELIAIPIEGLAEIGPMPKITALPNLPSWLHGIINHRGEIISISDMAMLFDEEILITEPKNRLAILHDGKIMVGIGIDHVIATVSRPESECIATTDSRLNTLEPEVFSQSLTVEGEHYQILNPASFLQMERLMKYQRMD